MQAELNLLNNITSDINYGVTVFPDGHRHIDLSDSTLALSKLDELTIRTRLSSFDDLFVLLQAVNVMKLENRSCKISLIITYLLAGRYDRPMYQGDSFDLKIVCDIINSLDLERVGLIEPHSVVSTSLIDRSYVFNPMDMQSISIINEFAAKQPVVIVAPDLGAVKRAENYAKIWDEPKELVYMNKRRNLKTGEVVGMEILKGDEGGLHGKTCVIYDDLCDGGRTFIEAAKILRARGSNTIVLIVTHGIFSQGLAPLYNGGVDYIITTNSYRGDLPVDDSLMTVIDVS